MKSYKDKTEAIADWVAHQDRCCSCHISPPCGWCEGGYSLPIEVFLELTGFGGKEKDEASEVTDNDKPIYVPGMEVSFDYTEEDQLKIKRVELELKAWREYYFRGIDEGDTDRFYSLGDAYEKHQVTRKFIQCLDDLKRKSIKMPVVKTNREEKDSDGEYIRVSGMSEGDVGDVVIYGKYSGGDTIKIGDQELNFLSSEDIKAVLLIQEDNGLQES